jgi:DNA-binding CsgD family transcriptional regulator
LHKQALKLKARPAENAKVFCDAFEHASVRRKLSALQLQRNGQSPLSVCMVPHHERRTASGPTPQPITLFISDPDDRNLANLEVIRMRWQLTALEARIAIRLAQGQSVKEIGGELQLTLNTARWYSKQIMQKIGVRRQAQLCITLLSDVALLING